jgi:putative transcriptional regulator
MAIIVKLDVMLAERKVKSKDLAEHVGITEANMSLLKQGRVKGIRFDTLNAICEYLRCEPGDILRHVPDAPSRSSHGPQAHSDSGTIDPEMKKD